MYYQPYPQYIPKWTKIKVVPYITREMREWCVNCDSPSGFSIPKENSFYNIIQNKEFLTFSNYEYIYFQNPDVATLFSLVWL